MSRPSLYSAEMADKICEGLVSGKPLATICRADDMPSESTVYLWVSEDREGFSEQYARARETQALRWADELIEISDDGSNDTYTRDGEEKVNHDHIQRSKLRVDTRKWLLSKMLPKVYGERTFNEHVIDDVRGMSREDAQSELDKLRGRAGDTVTTTSPQLGHTGEI